MAKSSAERLTGVSDAGDSAQARPGEPTLTDAGPPPVTPEAGLVDAGGRPVTPTAPVVPRFACSVPADRTVPAVVVEAPSGHPAEARELYLKLIGVIRTEHEVSAVRVSE